jgi:hypothetical protein
VAGFRPGFGRGGITHSLVVSDTGLPESGTAGPMTVVCCMARGGGFLESLMARLGTNGTDVEAGGLVASEEGVPTDPGVEAAEESSSLLCTDSGK